MFSKPAFLWDAVAAEQLFMRALPSWGFLGFLLESVCNAAEKNNLSVLALVTATQRMLLWSQNAAGAVAHPNVLNGVQGK